MFVWGTLTRPLRKFGNRTSNRRAPAILKLQNKCTVMHRLSAFKGALNFKHHKWTRDNEFRFRFPVRVWVTRPLVRGVEPLPKEDAVTWRGNSWRNSELFAKWQPNVIPLLVEIALVCNQVLISGQQEVGRLEADGQSGVFWMLIYQNET